MHNIIILYHNRYHTRIDKIRYLRSNMSLGNAPSRFCVHYQISFHSNIQSFTVHKLFHRITRLDTNRLFKRG